MTPQTLSREQPLAELDQRVPIELGQRFRIDGLLGRGPQSVVFRAVQAAGATPMALKVVPKGAHDVAFLRATATASDMEHPHIVPVQLAGQTKHLLWYTMPLVEDPSLDRVLAAEGPLEVKRCLRLVEQIASALQYGHRRGVSHGGVKPENVFVNHAGWTLLADFGIPGAAARLAEDLLPDRTRVYAAPEILQGGEPIPASDQYSLAVLVHECLTGVVPESGAPVQPAPDAPARELPLRVEHALRRAMAPVPQDRFPTVLGFLAALDGGPSPVVSSFAPSPNKKREPRVLTMEPESRVRRYLIRAVVLGVTVVLAMFSPRIWRSERLESLRDRIDRWYEADAPAAAMATGGSQQNPSLSSTATTPESTLPGTARPQPEDGAARAVAGPPPASVSRRPARTSAPSKPAARRAPPPPVEQPEPAPVEPARLLVNATPWGTVYLDGRPVGNTPLRDVEVAPGAHVIRITHEGYEPFESSIDVTAGQQLRLTGIVLREARR
ncbi:MAG: serine/threonine protein kinase [Gemmatimonadetes bacterium]|nr:serine/threonine protein kinase [Gemmatimonadota bacterium]